MKVTHPRKIVKYMKDFLNAASDLIYINDDDIKCKRTAKLIKYSEFAAFLDDEDWAIKEPFFRIGYNIEDLYIEGTKIFRCNFVSRCSMVRGFANITITLLHELGHFVTNKEVENWAHLHRQELCADSMELYKANKISFLELQERYFMLVDETAATDWAIEWLKISANRKLAKEFEKKFFSCIKK